MQGSLEGNDRCTKCYWVTNMPSKPVRFGHLYGPQGHAFCKGNCKGDQNSIITCFPQLYSERWWCWWIQTSSTDTKTGFSPGNLRSNRPKPLVLLVACPMVFLPQLAMLLVISQPEAEAFANLYTIGSSISVNQKSCMPTRGWADPIDLCVDSSCGGDMLGGDAVGEDALHWDTVGGIWDDVGLWPMWLLFNIWTIQKQ